MLNKPDFPLRVYFDGSCSVCATEIEHYLHRDGDGRLVAVDISAADFDPEPLRISRDVFMYELHAIDRSGRVYRGVEAFWAIWQAFPAGTIYGVLGVVITLPLINPVARMFYRWFARIRPFLPKRHNCRDGSCQLEGKKRR